MFRDRARLDRYVAEHPEYAERKARWHVEQRHDAYAEQRERELTDWRGPDRSTISPVGLKRVARPT